MEGIRSVNTAPIANPNRALNFFYKPTEWSPEPSPTGRIAQTRQRSEGVRVEEGVVKGSARFEPFVAGQVYSGATDTGGQMSQTGDQTERPSVVTTSKLPYESGGRTASSISSKGTLVGFRG